MSFQIADNREHRFLSLEEFRDLAGKETGVSDWFTITQEHIDAFADVSGDYQYIHVDPEKAASSPVGGTIAHGFLTLTLLGHLAKGPRPRVKGVSHSLNYGFDRVRFIEPVRAGSRIRGRYAMSELDESKSGQLTVHWDATMEIENSEKPAIIARWIWRVVL